MPSPLYQPKHRLQRRHAAKLIPIIFSIGLTISSILVTGNAIARLIYAALGQSPNSKLGIYGIVLYGFLTIAAIASVLNWQSLRYPSVTTPWIEHRCGTVASSTTFAILGFYHMGIWTNQQPIWAISGAIAGLLVGIGLSISVKQQDQCVVGLWLRSMQGTATYGAAFANGAIGLMSLSVGYWWGAFFMMFCMIYLIGSVNFLLGLRRQITYTSAKYG